ncbi:MAG: hypothetical protein AMXMBFR56_82140 [Polyangiaceae bacterium]
MTRLLFALLLLSCATPPELVREPAPAVRDAGVESGGSEMSTPNYGEEYTITCGGEVSLVSGTGRTLLKLDRSAP